MKLSIIIPVYNEEKTVESVIHTVITSIEKLSASISDYEIIVVDDGSKDNTKMILKQKFLLNDKVKLQFQEINKGKGASIKKGISLVTGDVILIQDADFEYDPFQYPVLLKPILEHKADVVFGSRFLGETHRVLFFWHMMGNKFLTLLSNMFTNLNLTDMEACYKVFKTEIVKPMKLESNRFGIEPEFTAKVAKIPEIRIYEVPISYAGRTYAEGKKIGWKDGVSAIWSIVKFNLLRSYEDSFYDSKDKIRDQLNKPNLLEII